jgi:hypothetical protein
MKKIDLLAKFYTIQHGLDFIAVAAKDYADLNMPNNARKLEYYRSCLLLPPEEDILKISTMESDLQQYLNK